MALTRPRAYQIYDIDYKQAVRVVTVSDITLSGGAPNQVDGVTLSLNDRILVTGQGTGSQNGIYYVTTLGTGSNGTWARSTDTNSTGELLSGTIVMVTEGLIYADTQWKLTTDDPITIGSTSLTFVQNYSANSISSGTSNVVVGSNANVTISVAGTSNALVIGDTQITSAGNIFPAANITYDLGDSTHRFKDIWLANSSIYLGNVTLSANANQLLVGGDTVVTFSPGGEINTSGNVSGGNLSTSGSLTVTGNIYTGNILTDGYYYANGVQFAGGGGGTPGGANTYVQFNNNGIFGGTAGFTFNPVTNAIATSGTFDATGNISGGNLSGTNITGTLATSAQTNITSVGTLSSLSVSGNISGGNIIQGGSRVIKWTTVANTAPTNAVAGDFWYNSYTGIKYQYVNDGTGNAWVDQSSPTTFSTITVGGIVNSNANGVGNIGASGGYFNTVFAKATSAQYADLAEIYVSDNQYPPTTVVVFGGANEITITDQSHDSRVAGVISTNPAYLMNSDCKGLPVAFTGRVPCQVQGPVLKGQLLVTSNIPGVAQAIDNTKFVPGCVIGKSLENISDNTITTIEVVVGRF